MSNVMFSYNQAQAVKAGQANFISETGAYTGKITVAKWVTSQGGAKALELSFESDDGLKCDYLSIWYSKKDGEPLPSGENMIQAIMGCTGVKGLTASPYNELTIAPELTGKRVGLMLQKVLRLKQDGTETHGFSLLCPFSPNSRKTLLEHVENRPAERIDWLVAHTKDKDERAKQAPQAGGYTNNYANGYTSNYANANSYESANKALMTAAEQADLDDDIPF